MKRDKFCGEKNTCKYSFFRARERERKRAREREAQSPNKCGDSVINELYPQ